MRAQITIFIIIGILVVVAFGITLYAGSKMSTRIETKQTTQRLEQLGLQPLQDYINTCLSLATKEGLKLIGQQGGTLYVSQGGLTPDYTDEEEYITQTDETVIKVPYRIMPPEENVGDSGCNTPEEGCEQQQNCCLLYSVIPAYPFPGFPYAGGELLFTGYYGMSKLPPLYKKTPTGENVTNSIQENLERYITRKTEECAKWTTFEDQNYQITPGTPTTSLIFAENQTQFTGEKYVTIELNWPIEITTPGGDKANLNEFAVKENVRLATVYFTAKQIIDADVTDISYIPEDRGAFTVTTLNAGEDSIITLKDGQSTLDNKPYEFWIARKNRPPALWQIDTTGLANVRFHVSAEDTARAQIRIIGNKLSIKDPCQDLDVPDPFVIQLNASDPDENQVTYKAIPSEITLNDVQSIVPVGIRVYAKDNSAHPDDDWYDYQDIQINTALCPVGD